MPGPDHADGLVHEDFIEVFDSDVGFDGALRIQPG
jgi:hypothetical protein